MSGKRRNRRKNQRLSSILFSSRQRSKALTLLYLRISSQISHRPSTNFPKGSKSLQSQLTSWASERLLPSWVRSWKRFKHWPMTPFCPLGCVICHSKDTLKLCLSSSQGPARSIRKSWKKKRSSSSSSRLKYQTIPRLSRLCFKLNYPIITRNLSRCRLEASITKGRCIASSNGEMRSPESSSKSSGSPSLASTASFRKGWSGSLTTVRAKSYALWAFPRVILPRWSISSLWDQTMTSRSTTAF